MYRWVEHTAELELAIEAPSEREVLEEALVALAELLTTPRDTRPRGRDPSQESRHIVLSAPDRPALLAGWLEELVYLAESEGFVPTAVRSLELREDALDASVGGVIDEPAPLVKAVTYHRLAFEPRGEGYTARVVLDV